MISKTALDIFAENQTILAGYAYEWNLENYYTLMDEAYHSRNEKELIKQANELWFALPDRSAIRSQGFFALCDIAERMFE